MTSIPAAQNDPAAVSPPTRVSLLRAEAALWGQRAADLMAVTNRRQGRHAAPRKRSDRMPH